MKKRIQAFFRKWLLGMDSQVITPNKQKATINMADSQKKSVSIVIEFQSFLLMDMPSNFNKQ